MNKIGTIRDQYEWQPASNPEDWLIEEEKMARVQPLVDFINHAGELKSTKVRETHSIASHGSARFSTAGYI
jgi:hypothetical protein